MRGAPLVNSNSSALGPCVVNCVVAASDGFWLVTPRVRNFRVGAAGAEPAGLIRQIIMLNEIKFHLPVAWASPCLFTMWPAVLLRGGLR